MADQTALPGERTPADTKSYLSGRLDGARDLYLLALAIGTRGDEQGMFGNMIREARIHFAALLEEAKIAGLDTNEIAVILGQQKPELDDSVRPDLRKWMETLTGQRDGRAAGR